MASGAMISVSISSSAPSPCSRCSMLVTNSCAAPMSRPRAGEGLHDHLDHVRRIVLGGVEVQAGRLGCAALPPGLDDRPPGHHRTAIDLVADRYRSSALVSRDQFAPG